MDYCFWYCGSILETARRGERVQNGEAIILLCRCSVGFYRPTDESRNYIKEQAPWCLLPLGVPVKDYLSFPGKYQLVRLLVNSHPCHLGKEFR